MALFSSRGTTQPRVVWRTMPSSPGRFVAKWHFLSCSACFCLAILGTISVYLAQTLRTSQRKKEKNARTLKHTKDTSLRMHIGKWCLIVFFIFATPCLWLAWRFSKDFPRLLSHDHCYHIHMKNKYSVQHITKLSCVGTWICHSTLAQVPFCTTKGFDSCDPFSVNWSCTLWQTFAQSLTSRARW